jgi:hypothetical protein
MKNEFIYRLPAKRRSPRRDAEREWIIRAVRAYDPTHKPADLRAMDILALADLYKKLRGY